MTSINRRLAALVDISGDVTVPNAPGETNVPNVSQVQSNQLTYVADTGTANVYVVNLTPAITALTDGLVVDFQVLNTNTGTSTLNVNGLGAYPIIGGAHQALQSGELVATGKASVMWHNSLSSWVIMASSAGSIQVPNGTQSYHATNLSQVQTLVLGTTSASITAAGTNQGTATALTSNINVITTAAAGTGVSLPTPPTGKYSVITNKGANPVYVYPGTSGTIDGGAANAPITLGVGSLIILYGVSATQWFSSAYASTAASTITGTLAVSQGGTGVTTSTGSGNVVLSTSPTLVTPALGTPSALVLTNATGLPLGGSGVTGTLGFGNGGTGATTQQLALNAIAGAVTSGYVLRGNGTNVTLAALQATDIPTLNQNTTGSAASLSATLVVASGGTGATTLTGIIKGTGTTAMVPAVAGTDYIAPPSGTAILKANSGGALANAVANTDYLTPPSGSAILKAGAGGALANATAGTDYLAPPSGTSLLKANSGGALVAAVAGTDYVSPAVLGANSGVATLNSSGQLTASQIPTSLLGAVVYQGTWNASTNSPTLVSGTGTKGNYYKVSTAGSTLIDGNSSWLAGDTIIFDGTVWDKIDGISSEVISVNGSTGAVVITLASLGGATSGANSNITSLTGLTTALSVAQGGTGVTTSTGTGSVVLSTSPTLVTPALGTPASGIATNITGLPLTTGVTGILPVSNGGTGASTLTGLVKGTGTTAMVAATAGTDYQLPIGTISGIAKGNGANALIAAVANTDYLTPPSGSAILKAGSGGALVNAVAGTDYVSPSVLGAASGVATLDGTGKLTTAQIPSSLVGSVVYQGTWNASTNTPTLVSGTGTKGWYYKVSTAGSTAIDGNSSWLAGDTIIFDGTTWDKIDGLSSEVISVNGSTGAVTITLASLGGANSGANTNITSLSAGVSAPGLLGSASNSVTAAGTTQGTATALTSDINVVTTVASGSGVILPAAVGGKYAVVINRGANALNLYPASGHSFDGLSVNVAISLPVNGYIELYGATSSLWYTTLQAVTNASMLQGTLAVSQGGTGVTTSTGSGNVVLSTSPTLVTPVLGTPTSVTLTNATGLPLTTGVTGLLPVSSGGTGIGTLTGLIKGNGTSAFSAAVSGTDYAPATSGTSILYGNGAGGFSNVTLSGLTFTGGVLSAAAGTVTSLSVASSNGFSGSFTATSTPVLTISTSITGILVGASGALTAATVTGTGAVVQATSPTLVTPALGTPSAVVLTNATGLPLTTGVTGTLPVGSGGTGATTLTGIVKGTGTTAMVAATAGTDYLAPPSGTALLKANSGGALANAVAGTDYLAPPTGSALLKANAGGALANAVAGTDYVAPSVLGANNGVATLNSSGQLTSSQIPASLVGAVVYQGVWNASTNTPTLVSGTGTKGYYYKVSVAGTTTIDTNSSWNIGDTIIFDGTVWDKIDGISSEVVSVNGNVGAVTITLASLGGATSGANSNITSLTGLTTALSVSQGGTGVTSSTGTGSVVLNTSPSLVTPALGTPASGVMTNVTGLPLTTGVTGTLGVSNGGTGVTTSTGSGSTVLSTSPTLVTPILGTPASGVMTNVTGLPLTTGVTGTLGFGNGGTGQTTQTLAINALAGAVTNGYYLRGNGTNVVMAAIVAGDVPTLNQNTTGSAGSLSSTLIVAQGGTGATSITGLVKGTGTTAMVAATAGTDYQLPIGTISGIAKGNGANALIAAVAGTDYVSPSVLGAANGVATLNASSQLTASQYPSYTTNPFGIGATPAAGVVFANTLAPSGATTAYQNLTQVTIPSGITTAWTGFDTNVSTAAASFTLPLLTHYAATQGTIGSGSSVTTQVGFNVSSTVVGAGTNIAFQGSIPASANNYNLYMNGTAQNYLAGVLNVANSTASTTPTTGAVTVTGGVGIGGNLNVNGNTVLSGNSTTSGTSTLTGAVTLGNVINNAASVTLASAATVNIGAAAANVITITGTVNISAFDTIAAGATRVLTFSGVLTLMYNATSMQLPSGANTITAPNDTAEFMSLGGGNWKCIRYNYASSSGGVAASYYTSYVTPTSNGQTVFTVVGGYTVGSLDIYQNGVLLYVTSDYTATNGTTFTLATGANTTDTFMLRAWTISNLNNSIPSAGGTMSGAFNEAPPATIASASTMAIGAALANTINVTGTTTVTGFDVIAAGAKRTLIFGSSLQLTYNSTSMKLPGFTNITTQPGDVADFISLGSGNWECINYVSYVLPSNLYVTLACMALLNQ